MRTTRGVITACVIGSSLEWGDFFLYATASALVFPDVYFPNSDPFISTLLSFATYGAGFVARPIGAVVFGYFGDRIGRKEVLTVSLLVMGMATFLIGLLPSYASIGLAAPIALAALHLLQGFSLGGYWSGVVTMCIEHVDDRPGLTGGWPQSGLSAGDVIAVGTLSAMQFLLPKESFASWGWRLPFLLSGALMLVALWIREQLEESPKFTALTTVSPNPVVEVLRTHRRQIAAVFCARIGTDVSFYVFTVYLLSYLNEHLHLGASIGLNVVLIAAAIQAPLMPLAGALSDRLGRRRVYLAGTIGAALWAFAFFPLLGSKSFPLILLAVTVALGFHAAMYGPQAAFITELFPVRLRYSGTSLGYHLASVPGGSIAPIIATWLFRTFHSTTAIAGYVVASLAITAVGLLLASPP